MARSDQLNTAAAPGFVSAEMNVFRAANFIRPASFKENAQPAWVATFANSVEVYVYKPVLHRSIWSHHSPFPCISLRRNSTHLEHFLLFS